MLCNRPSSPSLPSLHTQELAVFYFLIAYTLLMDCFVRKKGTGNLGQEWVSQLHCFKVADKRFGGYPRHWFIFNTLAITSTNAVFIDLGLVGGFWEVHLHHKGSASVAWHSSCTPQVWSKCHETTDAPIAAVLLFGGTGHVFAVINGCVIIYF